MIVSKEPFKVYLKTLELDDADSIAKHANNYEVVSNISPAGTFPYPYELSDAMAFIELSNNAFIEGVTFNFAICPSGTTEIIGACGIKHIDYKNMKCNIGYWLGRDYWGKGYGKDAVNLLLHVAFESLDMKKVYAEVMSFNIRSIKMLKSLGFKKESVGAKVKSHEGETDTVIFAINDKEYKNKKIKAKIKNWEV